MASTQLSRASFEFLSRVADAHCNELGRLRPKRLNSKQVVLSKGVLVSGAYFVTAGVLRVFCVTNEGREATLYRVKRGESCLLSMASVVGSRPYPASVEAEKGGATIVAVPSELFRRLVADDAAFREYVFDSLSVRVFELMATLEEVGTARVLQRVARHLAANLDATGVVRVTQAALAADLGTAREVVFRALRGLREQGIVSVGRGRIVVLDRRRLAAISEYDEG
jgi:CRP/FNR family transcriptional regulator